MDKMKKTLLTAMAIVLILAIGLWGIDTNQQGYLMVSELVTHPQEYDGSRINTMGTIKNGSLNTSTEAISFDLEDAENKKYNIHIVYTGDLPATLADGKSISLAGTMTSEGTIEASQIVAGCPSKYSE